MFSNFFFKPHTHRQIFHFLTQPFLHFFRFCIYSNAFRKNATFMIHTLFKIWILNSWFCHALFVFYPTNSHCRHFSIFFITCFLYASIASSLLAASTVRLSDTHDMQVMKEIHVLPWKNLPAQTNTTTWLLKTTNTRKSVPTERTA